MQKGQSQMINDYFSHVKIRTEDNISYSGFILVGTGFVTNPPSYCGVWPSDQPILLTPRRFDKNFLFMTIVNIENNTAIEINTSIIPDPIESRRTNLYVVFPQPLNSILVNYDSLSQSLKENIEIEYKLSKTFSLWYYSDEKKLKEVIINIENVASIEKLNYNKKISQKFVLDFMQNREFNKTGVLILDETQW